MHSDRKSDRRSIWYPGWIALGENALRECVIEDASDSGAKLTLQGVDAVPNCFKLLLSPTAKTYRNCIVKWRKENSVGVQYERTSAGSVEHV